MFFFFFNDTATTEIYTLSLHDALPIYSRAVARKQGKSTPGRRRKSVSREPQWAHQGAQPRYRGRARLGAVAQADIQPGDAHNSAPRAGQRACRTHRVIARPLVRHALDAARRELAAESSPGPLHWIRAHQLTQRPGEQDERHDTQNREQGGGEAAPIGVANPEEQHQGALALRVVEIGRASCRERV